MKSEIPRVKRVRKKAAAPFSKSSKRNGQVQYFMFTFHWTNKQSKKSIKHGSLDPAMRRDSSPSWQFKNCLRMRSIWGYQHQSQALANDRMQGIYPPMPTPPWNTALTRTTQWTIVIHHPLTGLVCCGGLLALGGYLVPLDFHDKWLNAFPPQKKKKKTNDFSQAPEIHTFSRSQASDQHTKTPLLLAESSSFCFPYRSYPWKPNYSTEKRPRDYQPRVGETQTLHFSEHIYSKIPVGFSEPFEPTGWREHFLATKQMRPSFLHSSDMKQHKKKTEKEKVVQQKLYKQKKSPFLLMFPLSLFFDSPPQQEATSVEWSTGTHSPKSPSTSQPRRRLGPITDLIENVMVGSGSGIGFIQ